MALRKVFRFRTPIEVDGGLALSDDVTETPPLIMAPTEVVLDADFRCSIDATFDCTDEASGQLVFQRRFAFPTTDPDGDLVAQAYAHVTSLPDYADAEPY